ncbi:hypothetical protein ACFL1Z_07805 [Thermodesulfobacteriota bacterium]
MVSLGPDDQRKLGKVLDSIAVNFDYVLLDTAAGIGPSVLWFNKYANQNIVVLTSTPTSLTDAYALIKTVSGRCKRKILYLILNLIREDQKYQEVYDRLEKATKQFLGLDLKYLGKVPEDSTVNKAVCEQTPFFNSNPDCKASHAVSKLADQIIHPAEV